MYLLLEQQRSGIGKRGSERVEEDRHCSQSHVIDCESFASPLLRLDFHNLALRMAGPQQLLLHLTLLISFTSFPISSLAAHVSWSSPAADAVFGPGDTLIASWMANSTTTTKGSKNSTTAFRLCELDFQDSSNGTMGCGEAVTPLIQQSAGSYTTTLQVPHALDRPYSIRCATLRTFIF